MGTLSAAGIGSGLDINGIISQLMALERRPLDALIEKQNTIDSQISAIGQLKSALSSFQDAAKALADPQQIQAFSTSSSDSAVFTASAGSSATQGSYNIVVNNLATAQKDASSQYADASTSIGGTGTLTITVGGNSMNLTVDASNNTLTGLADAINSAADNPGVTATIINESGGSRLILTSKETGAANGFSVSVTDDDGNNSDSSGLSQLFYVGTGNDQYARNLSTAQDASLTVDGFAVTSASNTVTGVISDVTLNLAGTGSATLDIQPDQQGTIDQVQSFVDAYNNLFDLMDSLKAGALASDSTLRGIERQIRGVLNTGANISGNPYTHLNMIGVSVDRYGDMSLDSSRLTEVMNEDPSYVTSLFSDATEGFAVRMDSTLETMVQSNGLLDQRTEGLNSRKDSLARSQERMEYRLTVIEANYRAQFAALDSLLASMQGTSNFLTQQLSTLGTS